MTVDVYDSVIADPDAYREAVLAQPFTTMTFGQVTFHGIAPSPDSQFVEWFSSKFPEYHITVTFVRKSPQGQVEPNDIHTDDDMGDITALLYLNPEPLGGDGTMFWEHIENRSRTGTAWMHDGHDRRCWVPWKHVDAVYNRCVVFSAPLCHSRAIIENYGSGEEARLVQVLFASVRE